MTNRFTIVLANGREATFDNGAKLDAWVNYQRDFDAVPQRATKPKSKREQRPFRKCPPKIDTDQSQKSVSAADAFGRNSPSRSQGQVSSTAPLAKFSRRTKRNQKDSL